jgi:ABC-type transport system involved in multi-copper enzyme maturation permease subunit
VTTVGLEMNISKVKAIARKEFMENVRNKWVLALSMLFLVLVMVFSYFGGAMSGGDVEFQGFKTTVGSISTIAAMLLPIIAIMLGYSTIIGERENGSMGVVLGCPVSRFDVILGKFLGLGTVLAATIFLGFGISGLIVGAIAGFDDALAYLLFMVLTVLFATFFLGFSIFMSAIASKRSTAIAGGLVIFFSGMIAGTILFGIWVATGGDFNEMLNQAMQGIMPQLPDWYWGGMFFSFMDIYPMGAMDLFNTTDFMGYSMEYPWFVNAPSYSPGSCSSPHQHSLLRCTCSGRKTSEQTSLPGMNCAATWTETSPSWKTNLSSAWTDAPCAAYASRS